MWAVERKRESLLLFMVDKDQTCQANEKYHQRWVIRLTLYKTWIKISSLCISVFFSLYFWIIWGGLSKLHFGKKLCLNKNKKGHLEKCSSCFKAAKTLNFALFVLKIFKSSFSLKWHGGPDFSSITLCRVRWFFGWMLWRAWIHIQWSEVF